MSKPANAALLHLDSALSVLRRAPDDLIKRALATVRLGVRGARALTWDEIRSLDEPVSDVGADPTEELPPQVAEDEESPQPIARSRLKRSVDMTSVCQVRPDAVLKCFPIGRSFFVGVCGHTRVSAEVGPVQATVDPADIRGLGTTLL